MKTTKQVRSELHSGAPARHWSQARLYATFGLTAASVRRNLVTATFCGHKVAVHKKVVPSLMRVMARIRNDEKKNKWGAWEPTTLECFNWRAMRGSSSRSHHSWGIALDIDAKTNPSYPHYTGGSKQTMTIPTHVVQAFKDEGWTVGVEWDAPCDTMHMQYA